MDLNNFKKVKDAKATAHFKHPDGHEIVVHKAKLHPEYKKQLASIPLHMEEGGQVPDYLQEPQPVPIPQYASADVNTLDLPRQATREEEVMNRVNAIGGGIGNAYNMAKDVLFKAPDQWGQQKPIQDPVITPMDQQHPESAAGMIAQTASDQPMQAPQYAQPPQQDVNPDPFGYGAQSQMQGMALQQQMQGITGQAQAEAGLGYAQARAAQEHVNQLQQQHQRYQENYNNIDREILGTIGDLKNGHINADRFWQNKSGWQRAGIMIGLALGGNPDILKTAIERDIDAQKANLHNQNNILAAQFKRMGNMRDAIDMTRLIQAGVYADKLQMAAANAQSPMAKAKAQQAMGQLLQQYAPLAQQLAMRRTLMGGEAQGGANQHPEMVIRALVPEGHQQAAFKELSEAQALEKGRQNALHVFDQVAKINTLANRVKNPVQSARQIDALIEPLVAALSKETAGRFTEQDAEMLRPLLKKSLGSDAKTQAIQRKRINELISEKMNFPMLRAYGINIGGQGHFDMSGRSRFDEGAPVK